MTKRRICRDTSRLLLLALVAFLGARHANGQQKLIAPGTGESPTFVFDRGYGQVEVGSVYAGAEFHDSRPLPSRISFYYPVANSIDLSTDYWKRGDSRPWVVGMKIGNGPKRWIGKEPWKYTLSPHTVFFERSERGWAYALRYEFCQDEPAMVVTLSIRNTSGVAENLEVYSHLRTALRTCQTYARLDSGWTEVDTILGAVSTHFDEKSAGRASVEVQNVGLAPGAFTSSASSLAMADSGWSRWLISPDILDSRTFPLQGGRGDAGTAFTYRQRVMPGDSMVIVQIVASAPRAEIHEIATRLQRTWREQVHSYDQSIRASMAAGAAINTGNREIDRSAKWAMGILAANRHYLDSAVVPMPCPAEYNFFFTHDVLLTNLAAVNFDLKRVKHDLEYIRAHASNDTIPHAYYWRDDGFKTELCTQDNWNHLWWILANGAYLRHSLDTATARTLYPYVTRSLLEILKQHHDDNVMYAFRPDWWDIGRNEGPRSYITILTIRALREYMFIGTMLGEDARQLAGYEQMADAMQEALPLRLWDSELGYLVNYNGAQKDRHYYMGSLLSVAYRLLDSSRGETLMRSASRHLLAPGVGVRTVWPVDFNTDSARAFFKFVGNEAGDPFVYANGGVWPHCNAFYALGLMNTGRVQEAYDFVKSTMTVDGVIRSPMGQPAMYEYRYSNEASPEYGKVDKPSFLWAGGFYLYTLYHLLGTEDTPWNVSLGGPAPKDFANASFSLVLGERKKVTLVSHVRAISPLEADGKPVPSLVVPTSLAGARSLTVRSDRFSAPYLASCNGILDSIRWDQGSRRLSMTLRSFAGHKTKVVIVSPAAGRLFYADGTAIIDVVREPLNNGMTKTSLTFPAAGPKQNVEATF